MGLGNFQAMDPKERLPEFGFYTSLCREMKVCKEYLHKPHSYFKSLPKEERLKLLFHEEWERRRAIQEQKKIEDEINASRVKDSIK